MKTISLIVLVETFSEHAFQILPSTIKAVWLKRDRLVFAYRHQNYESFQMKTRPIRSNSFNIHVGVKTNLDRPSTETNGFSYK